MPQPDTSFAQTASLTCPQCAKTFQAQVWLVVDAAARPDLYEKVVQETVHVIPCPQCGRPGDLDAPLLIYRPGQDPALLFSPAQGTSQEQDREQAGGLLGLLRQQIGDAGWQEAWEENTLSIPRPQLATFLRERPAAAERQAQADFEAHLERLRQEDPQAYEELQAEARRRAEAASLLQALQEFITARTWGESQRHLEAHPELLDDEALALLEALQQNARAQGDEEPRRILEEHRLLLQRCREIGIQPAFAEITGNQNSDKGIPTVFQADLQEAEQALQAYQRGDRRGLDRSVAAWERILNHPAFNDTPQSFQLAIWNDAGGIYLRRYWNRGQVPD